MKSLLKIMCTVFLMAPIAAQAKVSEQDIFSKASIHILRIDFTGTHSAYDEGVQSTATGFWLGGKTKLIVTNAHVASPGNPGTYYATDTQGRKFKLKLVYSNPLVDLAYMKPEDDMIQQPTSTYEYNTQVQENARVFMTGNNGGQGILQQTGAISDVYSIGLAQYPLHTLVMSLNSKGGASGSPVLDENGKMIGINYAASKVSALSVPVSYMIEDLQYLLKGEIPPKFDVGITLSPMSISDARRYYDFPNQDVVAYNKRFPGAKSRMLKVGVMIAGSGATKHFQPGDFVTHVNGQEIGPDLFSYMRLLNQSGGKRIEIRVVRLGKIIDLKMTPYDLNAFQCREIMVVGESILTQVDQRTALRTSLPLGSVGSFSNPAGSVLPADYFSFNGSKERIVGLVKILDHPIKTLDDVEHILPALIAKGTFHFQYINHGLFSLSGRPAMNASISTSYADYERDLYQPPMRIKWDFATSSWSKRVIAEK